MRVAAALPPVAAALLALTLAAAVAQAPRRGAGFVEPSRPLIANPGRTKLPAGEKGAIGRLDGQTYSQGSCSISDRTRCRITPEVVGGESAPDTQYGFIVAIYFNDADGGRYICTGTLLTPQLVLTAGHCGCGVRGTYTVDYRQDTRRGDERLYRNVDGAPLLFDQRVCYDGDLSGGRDLALVRLTDRIDPAQWKLYGYPADLIWNLRSTLAPGSHLTAVGYGYTESGQVGVRMQGAIPIASADCTEPGLASVCTPFAEMILAEGAGSTAARDTCGGDSGGPVFLLGKDRPKLVAVTSRAAPGAQSIAAQHCGGGGIYTLIGRRTVHEWLRANGVPEEVVATSK